MAMVSNIFLSMISQFFHHFHFTEEKFLIAGGFVDGGLNDPSLTKLTEVVEIVKSNSTPSFGQLPSRREGAVGTMFGNVPTMCGGWDGPSELDSCISFENSQWIQSHNMNEKRRFSAGVQINSTTFWILGGEYFYEGSYVYVYLDSTELIIHGQTSGIPGPKLPYKLSNFCAAKLSENEIFVVGGTSGSEVPRNEVWIFDPQNGFARKQGPSLNNKRYSHSCITMRVGDKKFIIVSGGLDENYLDSVEIYDPIDKIWHLGKKIC